MDKQEWEQNMIYVERIIREVIIKGDSEVFWSRNIADGPIKANVNCSDYFFWACADCEEIELEDIDELVRCIESDTDYEGECYWAAKKRNMRPQHAILDKMPSERRAHYLPFEDPLAKPNPKTGKLSERYPDEV